MKTVHLCKKDEIRRIEILKSVETSDKTFEETMVLKKKEAEKNAGVLEDINRRILRRP